MPFIGVRGEHPLAKARVPPDSTLACAEADTPLPDGRVPTLGPDASHPRCTPRPRAVTVLLDLEHSQTSKTEHPEAPTSDVCLQPCPSPGPQVPVFDVSPRPAAGRVWGERGPEAAGRRGPELPLHVGSSAWRVRCLQASPPPASHAPGHLQRQGTPGALLGEQAPPQVS